MIPDVLLELRRQLFAGVTALPQDDHRPHDRSPLLVRRGHHGGLGHGRMGDQCRFDLERADPVPRGDDYVIGASLEVQVSVFVTADPVPGVPWGVSRGVAVVEISHEEGRVRAGVGQHQLAVDDLECDAREREAHGARAHSRTDRVRGELAGLRLSVPVADLDPRPGEESSDHLWVERLSRGHQRPQRGQW